MNYIEDKIDDKPLTDEEYKELMKFDNHDIDIAEVEFKASTAEDIAARYDIANFMAE